MNSEAVASQRQGNEFLTAKSNQLQVTGTGFGLARLFCLLVGIDEFRPSPVAVLYSSIIISSPSHDGLVLTALRLPPSFGQVRSRRWPSTSTPIVANPCSRTRASVSALLVLLLGCLIAQWASSTATGQTCYEHATGEHATNWRSSSR